MLAIDEHPLLESAVVITEFDQPIGETPSPVAIVEKLAFPLEVPIASEADVKSHVRDMLRFGGYKPTGRGKPASEYLRQAVEKADYLALIFQWISAMSYPSTAACRSASSIWIWYLSR